ncbi:MAG TPA: malic enzyme-like NAD(P)-binding protein, partial [Gammaproteobacteria bacterium]|nr:malic enzyme-like NAD(P)-binding protein [Gammaproteobacteria bacterium]
MISEKIRSVALDYHEYPTPGKTCIGLTKPTETQADLALAYSPGVAEPVVEIARNPQDAYRYTNKGNLVGIISNGTAVLGLGNTGALSSKPVMEGKAVLFKRLANIDVFDIEVDCEDPDTFIEIVARIAPTFGGINLEDIKAPECFKIEQALRERVDIPLMHDDQHGTAMVVAAGLLNALELQNKKISDVQIVCAGAGAAGIASIELLVQLGANPQNIIMLDRSGVIHDERNDLNDLKRKFALRTMKRTFADGLIDADVFIGVSGPGVLTADMVKTMANKPVVFALSNPTPEILPELAFQTRKDLIMATGRSDYPNQVNNALAFPYIFRGALDTRATCINHAMQLAAVHAIKDLAKELAPQEVRQCYPEERIFDFGPQYILPKMLDLRLCEKVSSAVALAAIRSK